MDIKLLGDVEAASTVGVSVATIWRLTRIGGFPKPIKIGFRTLWRSDEVEDWIKQETRAFRAGERPQKNVRRPVSPGRRRRVGCKDSDAAELQTDVKP